MCKRSHFVLVSASFIGKQVLWEAMNEDPADPLLAHRARPTPKTHGVPLDIACAPFGLMHGGGEGREGKVTGAGRGGEIKGVTLNLEAPETSSSSCIDQFLVGSEVGIRALWFCPEICGLRVIHQQETNTDD